MHEMSYCLKMVNLAIETCKENDIKKVDKILVEVGQMTGVLPYYLQKYYPKAVKDTILEDSTLEVIEVLVQTKCDQCGNIYNPKKEEKYLCPKCGSGMGKVIKGRDVILKQVIGE